MRRLIPDTIAARTLLVLILGLMVSHVLSVAFYRADRESVLNFSGGEHMAERIATIVQVVEGASESERQRITEVAGTRNLHVQWNREGAIEDQGNGGGQTDTLRQALSAHLDTGSKREFRIRYEQEFMTETWENHLDRHRQHHGLGGAFLVSLQLRDLSWLNFTALVDPPEPIWSFRSALSMAVMLLAIVILSAVVVRRMTEPLGNFARAAAQLGTNVKAPPMRVQGPAEVRQAIQAFNEMQGRIERFVADRTQMLAAISHDLGTPITRLRLRAEFVEDDEQKEKMLADLDEMEKMVSSALSFARGEAVNERHEMVDLNSLLQRVCDEMADAGHKVTLEVGDKAVRYGCRPAALRRALTNLIDNGAKYGGQARVSLLAEKSAVVIRIDDDGPGIPEELWEEAFRPFQRLEASRSRETGGTGLGLAVSRTIIRAHGGDIALENRSEGGLRVEIRLPR